MIPRILVPEGARLPDVDVPSARRRPSSLDERTLVPNTLPIVQLDGHSTIPSNLPLESIATRVVVPRDINVEAVQRRDESNLPLQPTDMDERVTVPQGAMPPDEIPKMGPVSEELVEPDIIQTGEVSFLPPERATRRPLDEKIVSILSIAFHILLVLFLIFEPKIFGPHVRTNEEEEIARRQMTVLLPPGALDSLKPSPRPAPHQPVNVDPRVIRKVAPTPKIEPPPTPQPEPPKKELPSAPVPQPNTVAPTPKENTPTRGDLPKSPPKLETPDMPVPEKGLILPKQGSPGDTIRDAARNTGRVNTPVPMGGGGPLPGGRSQGGGGRGTAGAGIDLLTDTQGVNFDDYLRRVYLTVKQNWYSVMPESVSLGDQGKVSLQFKIMRDGSVPDGDPRRVFGSGKEPLDRAAVSSIRGSNPFQPLPAQFKGDYIELRFTYYYNLPIE
jgi:outer membrane biosynthesis protein TonB